MAVGLVGLLWVGVGWASVVRWPWSAPELLAKSTGNLAAPMAVEVDSSQSVAAWAGTHGVFAAVAGSTGRFGVPRRLSDARLSTDFAEPLLATDARGDAVVIWQRPYHARISTAGRYAALRHPEHAHDIQRVLSIPPKRTDRALVTFLDQAEIDALLAAPDRSTWTGRRDHALLLLAIQTGLRASELTTLNVGDVQLAGAAHVTCEGKGRKQRITPLTRTTSAVIRVWLAERGGQPNDPLFPTIRGRRLSRDGLERRLAVHVAHAVRDQPSLKEKNVTLHTLRHTAAMQLLHAGIDTTVIALWLGHKRVETTQIYLHADLALKEKALARTKPPDAKPGRYRPPDTLLAFLEAL
jgi:site-specific recombinase XerD